ncbi:hypothetical protein [Nocardia sp. NPDC004711]
MSGIDVRHRWDLSLRAGAGGRQWTGVIGTAEPAWQDVVLVRAACRYLRQVGLRLSEVTVTEILSAHAEFVRAFVEFFHAR